ncbi:RHS repeat-associated core domain-containing protein [Pseudomonas sp. Irchel s3h17]|uniref:RHS repeat-associated core domain-containing protein n=1 Tax=Pseudomonas sp. Irchel s3h17 TaxID=2009182 RepID=UPI000BA4D7C8|nr:RHS repeat-associated core domain-containing protein [Pseudomonas sp. Irchel s3h17]
MPVSRSGTVLSRYSYDPLDRQTDCSLLALPAIQRFYCKSRLATEIQGTLRTSVFQHDDQLLAQQRQQDGSVDTTLLATDQQRSVLGTRGLTGSHLLAYSPYGHRPAENGMLSLLGFNGERPDPLTGHYHLGNGYRQFNPVLMRFNSPDNWSPFGEGGLNAYGYCGGDSVNMVDRTGHARWYIKLLRHIPGLENLGKTNAPKPLLATPSAPGNTSKVVDNLQEGSVPPPLPPRGVPALHPPRPLTKPQAQPPKNFTIMENGQAWIKLPGTTTHAYNAKVPLNHDSIIKLRKEGVHIHPDLLSPDIGKSHDNAGFIPDTPKPAWKIRKQ